jgi:ADP-ribose pyrophosphatase YjhB (NUDIX family)
MTWWEVPGGKVEGGEDLWEAAARELAEEVNAVIEQIEEIGTGEFEQDGRRLRYTWYVARLVGGTPAVMEADRFDALRYFTPSEAATLDDASPSLRRLFELHGDRLRRITAIGDSQLAPS